MLIHIICNYNFTFYTEFTIIIPKFTNKTLSLLFAKLHKNNYKYNILQM